MSPIRVIVVDDDRSTAHLVAKLLADRGYDVDQAIDGSAALELIKREPYALAVLDYQMPGMNGIEVFREARKSQPDLLGVFLTAYTKIDTVFPAINAGVERVLAKPVSVGDLLPVVEELVGRP